MEQFEKLVLKHLSQTSKSSKTSKSRFRPFIIKEL